MSYDPNYETWAVKLWLDNEEGTYHEVTDHANTEPSAYDFAQWLEEYVDELIGEQRPTGAGIAVDLFTSAWQSVDWRYIAESYLEDAANERGNT